MELNRGEVHLYGQVEIHAVLQVPDLDPEPEQTEFYVVLIGSRLSHVTVAKRAEDGESLCFTVPGHDLQETASVTVYRHTEGGAKPCGGGASLKYVRDLPQEVAEYLLANSDCLSPQSHLEVLRRVSAAPGEGDREGNRSAGPGEEHYLGQTDQEEEGGRGGRPRPDPQVECRLREMDERITQAMANMDYPPEWSGKASQPREDTLSVARSSYLSNIIINSNKNSQTLFSSVNNLFVPLQSGFHPLYITETALLKVVNDLLTSADAGALNILILLDQSAAFDTVSHQILLTRLEDSAAVIQDVPQGSVLDPFLFIIYILSLGRILRHFNLDFQCYADDTQIYLNTKSLLNPPLTHIESCPSAIITWMQHNFLKLNSDKAELLLIGTKSTLTKDDTIVSPFPRTHNLVRLGLLHLSRFLIGQPKGQRALTMPNEEGDTPLQLAQRRGDHSLFMALATPPVPQRSPLIGVSCIWADRTRVLRVCPGSGSLSLSLTFLGGPESSVLGNILVLREKLTNHNILRQISALRGDVQMEDSYRVDVHTSDASDGGERETPNSGL
ncbi:uncharacterized protein LOC121583127 [Coregonus clupeaformis]|uniref:uncharacterized protein LOC121583127 n=1 Tax=Coregonus clupeaformis TaxID=59861 RepID=UPI001E1C7A73|nr:uncharacterized protein LOC121583127 [Coregonus clupeaformis]